MKRWHILKIEGLGFCPKILHISTTSNYSGSQSLSSIWDIQFSIFFLNFLKQNKKRHSKIERHGSCPKVSHISATSKYSGSQSLSSIWDIQFSIQKNIERHIAAVHEEVTPFENWRPRILPKSLHISTTSNYSGSQSLSSTWEIQFSIKKRMERHVAAVHEEVTPFKNWRPRILPKRFTHQKNIKLFW